MTIYDEMRSWLIECYPDDEEDIAELTDEESVKAVKKYYDGGINAFIVDVSTYTKGGKVYYGFSN